MIEARGGRLYVEEHTVDDLADRYGTPLYVYSASALRAAHAEVKTLLPAEAEVFFSLKANPNPYVAAVLREAGAGVELASLGELRVAQRAGFDPAKIVFAGPGKSNAELEAALESRVQLINIESLGEAARLSAIATRANVVQHVCLRINPAAETQGAGMGMGGKGRRVPFGIDEESAPEALKTIDRLPGLRLEGIHAYLGTQVLDAQAAAANLATAVRLCGLYTDALSRPPAVLDVGPGLGLPLFPGDKALDLDALRPLAAEALAGRPPGIRLIVELGRFLAGRAGVYVATVLDVKVSRGMRFAVLDGGMHHHAAAAGGFGNWLRKPYRLRAARERGAASRTAVVGPCCTPMDQFAADVELESVEPGDRVVVLDSGAYGLSVSPILFLSHETPAEVLVDGPAHRLVRRRVETGNLFVPES